MLVGDALPNLEMNLRQTESLLAKAPDAALSHRPPDASGAFQFSVAEIFAHIADARTMFARVYLQGAPYADEGTEGTYLLAPPGEDGRWEVQGDLRRPVLERHLEAGWEALAPALTLPAEALLTPTKGGERIHAEARAREEQAEPGANDELILSWGPANLVRVLLTCASHEAGHRGALVSLLRGQGTPLPD